MDTSILISLAALIVSILALPTSYFVAVRQVKVGLDEYERRSKRKARLLVADRLDEFYKIFYGTAMQVTGASTPSEFVLRLKDIPVSQLREIDAWVSKSSILDRLARAIDDLAATGYGDLPQSSDLITKLQRMRSEIALGSDDKRLATVGVIFAIGEKELQSDLRKK